MHRAQHIFVVPRNLDGAELEEYYTENPMQAHEADRDLSVGMTDDVESDQQQQQWAAVALQTIHSIRSATMLCSFGRPRLPNLSVGSSVSSNSVDNERNANNFWKGVK